MLRYATLRAEPDWQALGKRLGKALNVVSKAIKVRHDMAGISPGLPSSIPYP